MYLATRSSSRSLECCFIVPLSFTSILQHPQIYILHLMEACFGSLKKTQIKVKGLTQGETPLKSGGFHQSIETPGFPSPIGELVWRAVLHKGLEMKHCTYSRQYTPRHYSCIQGGFIHSCQGQTGHHGHPLLWEAQLPNVSSHACAVWHASSGACHARP